MNVIVKLPNGVEFDGTFSEFTELYNKGVFGQIVYVEQQPVQQQPEETSSKEPTKRLKQKIVKKSKKNDGNLSNADIITIMKNLDKSAEEIGHLINKPRFSVGDYLRKTHGGLRKLRKKLNFHSTTKFTEESRAKAKHRMNWINSKAHQHRALDKSLSMTDAFKLACKDWNDNKKKQ